MFLLSTEICLLALREKHQAHRQMELMQQFQIHSLSEIAVCSVVKQELLFQARTSQRVDENLRLVRAFLAPLVNLPFDERCAEEAALLRSYVEGVDSDVGIYDLLTVAAARAYDTVLVVKSYDKFRAFIGVQMETW